MTITGHDIAREIERIGVPEGMSLFVENDCVRVETDGPKKPCAALLWRPEHRPAQIKMPADHPRAMEAATLLLRAYDAAKVWDRRTAPGSPLSVACPRCGADVGVTCCSRRREGSKYRTGLGISQSHKARKELAASKEAGC